MMLASLFLLILAGLANAGMDLIQFRWRGSGLERRSQRPDRLGKWLAGWVSPSAWQNKHRRKGLLGLLMRTVLVAFTDAWHACQWVMWTATEVNVLIWAVPALGVTWRDGLLLLVAAKVVRGVAFELLFSSPKYSFTMKVLWRALVTWAYLEAHRAMQVVLVVTFLSAVGVAALWQSELRVATAVVILVVGVALSLLLMRWSRK